MADIPYDTSFRWRGVYVDIVRSHAGTWSVLVANQRLSVGHATKGAAFRWLCQWAQDQGETPVVIPTYDF